MRLPELDKDYNVCLNRSGFSTKLSMIKPQSVQRIDIIHDPILNILLG